MDLPQPPSNLGGNSLSKEDLRLLRLGIDQFNQRQFFQCHETLENIWQQKEGMHREALQGLIQLAVAHHHFLNNNPGGGLTLLKKALSRLTNSQPAEFGLDIPAICKAVQSNINLLTDSPQNTQSEISIPRLSFL